MTVTIEQIRAMNAQTINERWDEIAAALAAQLAEPAPAPWRDPGEAQTPITMADICPMREVDIKKELHVSSRR